MKKHTLLLFLLSCIANVCVDAASYTNPIMYLDYSDPDAIRVGDDFYMTASSFNCSPGLPILHSRDLVHWELVSHALPTVIPGGVGGLSVEHGNQVWAPSIRHHDGLFYIMWGDPDTGIWQVHAENVCGQWSEPILVIPAKGFIDACPFWDEDGRTYIVHALAGSRAGMKSLLLLAEVDAQLTHQLVASEVIYDGHATQPTCEGPKMYRHEGYYYIFHPAGGVATGWQTVLRAKQLYGPWEEKIVMQQEKSSVNGPHQGAWVRTQQDEDWFIHFQDVGPLGRILHLQPMCWREGWPVIGMDENADGIGHPVSKHAMPKVTSASDDNANHLGINTDNDKKHNAPYRTEQLLGFQWQAQPEAWWSFVRPSWGGNDTPWIRLFSVNEQNSHNLWMQPNLFLTKIEGPDVTYTTEVRFSPSTKMQHERCGLLVFGMAYSGLFIEKTEEESVVLYYAANAQASKKTDAKESLSQTIPVPLDKTATIPTTVPVRLRVAIHSEDPKPDKTGQKSKDHSADKIVTARYEYQIMDGTMKKFKPLGEPFLVQPGKWIGAKVGLFCTRPAQKINDGGWMDVMSFEKR
ncbi:MAG: glycoside hydrolase 43 family protein [Paludibacteraceae bacterium]|nr:glycoside hydrolase 43 family protein [Paludibacteraceae bacterium]